MKKTQTLALLRSTISIKMHDNKSHYQRGLCDHTHSSGRFGDGGRGGGGGGAQDTHKNYLELCSVDPACIGCSDMRKSYKKITPGLEVDMLWLVH